MQTLCVRVCVPRPQRVDRGCGFLWLCDDELYFVAAVRKYKLWICLGGAESVVGVLWGREVDRAVVGETTKSGNGQNPITSGSTNVHGIAYDWLVGWWVGGRRVGGLINRLFVWCLVSGGVWYCCYYNSCFSLSMLQFPPWHPRNVFNQFVCCFGIIPW